MDRHVDEAMVRRLVACVVLAAIFFSLGLSIGQSRDTAPEPALPLSGEELWQSLPLELLANVAEVSWSGSAGWRTIWSAWERSSARKCKT